MASRKSREHWVRAALDALRDSGIEGVRVEPLALSLEVTKGSFYWHFANREALLDAMLDAWEEAGTEAIIREVASNAPATDQLRALWKRTLEDSHDDLRTELAIRELGLRDEAVRARVQRVDDKRMRFVRDLFRQMGLPAPLAEARSLLLYSLLIGNHFIDASHGRLSRGRVLRVALEELLAADAR